MDATENTPNPTAESLRESVIEVLRSVYDPEIPVNIYELGLVYGIEIDEENHVKVRMTTWNPSMMSEAAKLQLGF